MAEPTEGPAAAAAAAETPNYKAMVEQGYDLIADRYLAWSGPRPTTTRSEYITKLLAALPPGASVLELGCGAGVPSTQRLVEAGLNVTGNDISAAQIALARQHVPKATLIQGDMMNLSFPPASFDAVIAFYSIFHLPKGEQPGMIAKIKGWLKEGGWFLCNFHSELGDTVREGWFDPAVTMFSSGLGVEGTREIFKGSDGAGLRVVEDEVAEERVGNQAEHFHWIMAVKEASEGKVA